MEEFSLPTKIVSGAGAISALEHFGAKRLFLVTNLFFMKNGTAQQVAEATKATEIAYFDVVQPNPTVALAAEGAARLRAFGPDLLVALGGGSAIDCAKAMVYFSQGCCPLAAIPTTSGSGAEVTASAILTHGKARHPLVDEKLRPNLAILDSSLLAQLPKRLIADAGFDVLTHALESYTAANASAFSNLFAMESFRIAFGSLPASFAGRQEVRLRVHMAATMAGIAFSQAGLGICHAISQSLGSMFHVPHGRLNAILLPAVITCNTPAAGAKYAELARSTGLSGSSDDAALRNLKNGLLRLRKELELPQTLAQAGITRKQLAEHMPMIVETVLEDPSCASNPVPVEEFLIRRILEEAAGGMWAPGPSSAAKAVVHGNIGGI